MSKPRSSLRRRLLLGLFGYVALLTLAVAMHGLVFNEYAEQQVWQTLLDSELDHVLERRRSEPDYRWVDTDSLAFFDGRAYDGRTPATIPPTLRGLAPGVHDDVVVGDSVRVALVRHVDGRPLILSLDITELEQREHAIAWMMAGSAIALLLLLGLAVVWGVDRLIRPLSTLAQRIEQLRPNLSGQRIEVPDSASAELVVMADALNGYLVRNDQFVERERVFIDSASHELRTPIAVIAGASGLALSQPDLPAVARNQLARIQRTAKDVEQLITLLLVLAKDPSRLARASDRIALDQLLPEIVEDHRHLTGEKGLTLSLGAMPACEIVAPLPIVQTAIGNLLRNAIEHSDRGEILIRLETPATVVIDDPGHGMTPDEVSAIYARLARGGGDRAGGGIGLDLISRLCEHLDWTLDMASHHGKGTRTTLRFRG